MTRRVSRRRRWVLALVGGCLTTVTAALFAGVAWAHDMGDLLSLLNGPLRAYAQRVVDDPQTPFIYFSYSCPPKFPHQRTCVVNYDTEQSRAEELKRQNEWVCPVPPRTPCGPRKPRRIALWACTEQLLAYMKPHPLFGGRELRVYLKHISRPCGRTRLLGPTF